MSIPLVQNNEKDSINTSIIAIKKNLERINSILGLVDSGSDIDTSEFVKKSDIVDVAQSGNMNPVTSNAVVPVDTVTSGDMHSVTSNAVYNAVNDVTIMTYSAIIGTYTLSAGQTLSFNISSHIPTTPTGYTKYTYAYVSDQNYGQTSINFVGSKTYITITNHYSGTLTYTLNLYILFFKHRDFQ